MRWNEHRVQRRAAFVAAGARAIDLHGGAASAEQVAEVAGVSRTVLYRYFRDREDLRQGIADHVAQSVVDTVLPKLLLTAASTPHEIIEASVSVIVGWLDEHPNLYLFLRTRSSLDVVENTLADTVAGLLKTWLILFGIAGEPVEPVAYGVVGFVEASGGWWLQHRSMPRDRFTAIVCDGVWQLLAGTATAHGITVGYDDPLPLGALRTQETR